MGLWLAVAPAWACDAKALVTEMQEASPIAVSRVYVQLAECDPAVARSKAADALSRMVGDKDAEPAVSWLVELGEGERVRAWMDGLEPHDKSRLVVSLGDRCKDSAAIEAFLKSTHDALGARFWEQRWHRGLADCRTEGIQALLTAALDDPTVGRNAKDRSQFFGLMEVYARNLGKTAIPTLVDVVKHTPDGKEVGVLLGTFVDAAHVGSADATEGTAEAIAAVEALGPSLPPDAIDQARAALEALGAHETASAFVRYRWPDRLSEGAYVYTAISEEVVTCKNGKKYGYFRFGDFTSAASWPDELSARLEQILREHWNLGEEAEKCGGSAQTTVRMTDLPFAGDTAARKDWLGTHLKAFQTATSGFQKTSDASQPAFALAD